MGVTYLAHEVIIAPTPSTDFTAFEAALSELDARVVSEGSRMSNQFGFMRVELPVGITADEAIDRLTRGGVVSHAERHYLVETSRLPDDPSYGNLWGMNVIGAPAAWEHGTGSADMVVAVIDTGIDIDHPDLVANLWRNPGEVPGNGVDDDGNGFVDDVHGWNFVNNDAVPDDDHGHGTHCAGTIGAVGNNGVGVAGVNWTVSLMGLKVLGANGSGSLWGLAEAILYASELGVPVASASLGCDGCNVSYVRSALDTYQASGGLFVAAAGNSGKNNDSSPHYPSSPHPSGGDLGGGDRRRRPAGELTSMYIATQRENNLPILREVCVYFEYKLYRGNRTTKLSAEQFDAFISPNYPFLMESGVHLKINKNSLYRSDIHKLKINRTFSKDVVILKLFPGITQEVIHATLNIPNLKGVVLETFGSGNAPTDSSF